MLLKIKMRVCKDCGKVTKHVGGLCIERHPRKFEFPTEI